ncbi:glycosyltransferase 87 family protein [Micromonospora sp. LOL_021]|uniref:glycosyltransferase 87 family protein n=1 Tax=Micromonospora sp. LOL_021 TaxID=3345417 RepID=UPI003A862B5D
MGDRRPAVRSWLFAGAFTAVLGVAAGGLHHTTGLFRGDLAAYRAAAVAAASGDGQLYQAVHHTTDGIALGLTYPPFAALLMQPLAVVAMPVAVAGWTAAGLVVLVAIIRLTLRWIGPPDEGRCGQ